MTNQIQAVIFGDRKESETQSRFTEQLTATYVDIIDNAKTNKEGHSKFLNRVFTSGVPVNFGSTSMQVVQRGAGANMSVDVSIGDVHLERPTGDYSFWGWQDAVSNVAITTAPVTNSRIDAIVASVDVSLASTTNSNSPGALKFQAIAGTVSGSPTAPVDATIQTALGSTVAWTRLANVTVGTSVTSIVTGNISDQRADVKLRAATVVDASTNELLKLSSTASAVNEITVGNAATGNGPTISATGNDTNIDIRLTPKGTGNVKKAGNNIDWWEELGRTTLGSAGDIITVSISARKFLKVLLYIKASGVADVAIRFNGDTAANYASQYLLISGAGTTPSTSTSTTLTYLNSGSMSSGDTGFGAIEVYNPSGAQKMFTSTFQYAGTSASVANPSAQVFGHWVVTSGQITSVSIINSQSGDYAAGSEVVVLGHD